MFFRRHLDWLKLRSLPSIFRASGVSNTIPRLATGRARGYRSGKSEKVDEGLSLGDYPVLPWRSAQELSPYGWWDEQDRRNKEDPLHEQDDMLNMWVCDYIENNGRYTKWEALGQLTVAFSILGVVYWLSVLYDAPSRKPCVPRQFPYNNLYLSNGGDPSKSPTNAPSNSIKSTYGEYIS